MENLYKRRFPKRNFHHQVLDVLRLDKKKYKQFQSVANQFAGNEIYNENIRRPKQKVLPNSYKTITEVQPNTLAALLHLERMAHNDHKKNFHEGGGLLDATKSIFRGLWNTIGLGPEFNDFFNFFDYNSPENRISDEDKQYARIVHESYVEKEDRDDEVNGWVRDTDIGNDKFSVWVEGNDKVHVALRGTKKQLADAMSDINIIKDNTSGNLGEITEFLRNVQDKYKDYDRDVSAHSLGANQLMESFEKNADLDYERVNLFQPGLNPLANLDEARQAVKDDMYHFYLNSADMISNTFVHCYQVITRT